MIKILKNIKKKIALLISTVFIMQSTITSVKVFAVDTSVPTDGSGTITKKYFIGDDIPETIIEENKDKTGKITLYKHVKKPMKETIKTNAYFSLYRGDGEVGRYLYWNGNRGKMRWEMKNGSTAMLGGLKI